MATSSSALLLLQLVASVDPGSPYSGAKVAELVNATGGRRWKNGQGSGQIDRVYYRAGTLSAGATDTLNFLAAGSLEDIEGQTIDADELKGLILQCVTGEITFEAPASNGLAFFKAASDGVVLSAGQTIAVDFGAAGLDVSAAAQCSIDDSGGAGATYKLLAILAQ